MRARIAVALVHRGGVPAVAERHWLDMANQLSRHAVAGA
jgi:hypothetical protein